MLIDSHCHLDFPELSANLTECLAAMDTQGVSHALCAGVTLERHPGVLSIVEPHARLFASVGVHPEETGVREPSVDELVTLAAHPKVIAIGETGLDYYWHKDAPEWQRERFRVHIRAARACGKPLIVHNRDATADTLRVLRDEGAAEVGGVLHCFTESWEVAEEALELGLYLSLSGVVTFKNAAQVKEVAAKVPLERLLIETDAPYLAPVPFRGKLNQPAHVRYVAAEIARLRGLSEEAVGEATSANFRRLFRLDV